MKKTNKSQTISVSAGVEALSRMEAALKRKVEIADRIEEINFRNNTLSQKQSGLRKGITDLQDRLDRLPPDVKSNTELRQNLRGELEQVRHDFSQASAEEQALNNEASHLKIELPSLTFALSAEGLLEHRRRIDQANAEVQNVQAVINEQRKAISEAETAAPEPIDRQSDRQDLMADIALGNATESDLMAFDEEVAKEQKAIRDAIKKAAPQIERAQFARSALPSLERKLSVAQDQLNTIESRSSEIEYRFFLGEAEKVGTQFVNHAMRLKELYLSLVGLDSIITSLGGTGFVHVDKTLHIPVFLLSQFDGLENQETGNGAFFNSDRQVYSEQIAQAAMDEKTRVAAILGVTFES